MQEWNKRLAVAAAVLLALSAFSYWDEISRADRFERGQKLLQSLDPDEIATIVLREGGETLTLERQGEGFVVREAGGYRARNDAINRLIRNLLEVELDRRVGAGEQRAAELGLTGEQASEGAIEVTFLGASGSEMVRVSFAEATDAENASYAWRASGEESAVFLTSSRVFLDAAEADYLDRELVEHPAADVVRIEGADFLLERAEGGDLELVQPAAGEAQRGEVSRLTSLVNRLRFDEVFVADAPEVADLDFDRQLRFELEDQSGYLFESARRGDEHFLRLRATYGVDRIEITREESDEELEEKSAILKRSDEVARFNEYHGSWIYRLESFDGEKLDIGAEELIGGE